MKTAAHPTHTAVDKILKGETLLDEERKWIDIALSRQSYKKNSNIDKLSSVPTRQRFLQGVVPKHVLYLYSYCINTVELLGEQTVFVDLPHGTYELFTRKEDKNTRQLLGHARSLN